MQGNQKQPIYLALSGGGTRAMAFHAGVLKFLAEESALERVKAISTVSGGSLLTGVIFHLSGYRWPSSTDYLDNIFPKIEQLLSDRFVEYKVGYARFLPDIPMIRKNAHWLTKLIEQEWGVNGRWSDIPNKPKWTVNVTNAETGKRVTFSGKLLECYQVGKTNAENFRLANILSASAAVPGVIGPWILDVDHEKWKKPSKLVSNNPDLLDRLSQLHLYDGGLYDNLGLEEFVNVGSGIKKAYRDGVVLVSDAGKPIDQKFDRSVINPMRAYDILAIPMDQTRALRIRDFKGHLRKGPGSGAHIRLGESYKSLKKKATESKETKDFDFSPLEGMSWQDQLSVDEVASVGTRLQGYRKKDLDRIIQHGYEAARVSLFIEGISPIKEK